MVVDCVCAMKRRMRKSSVRMARRPSSRTGRIFCHGAAVLMVSISASRAPRPGIPGRTPAGRPLVMLFCLAPDEPLALGALPMVPAASASSRPGGSAVCAASRIMSVGSNGGGSGCSWSSPWLSSLGGGGGGGSSGGGWSSGCSSGGGGSSSGGGGRRVARGPRTNAAAAAMSASRSCSISSGRSSARAWARATRTAMIGARTDAMPSAAAATARAVSGSLATAPGSASISSGGGGASPAIRDAMSSRTLFRSI